MNDWLLAELTVVRTEFGLRHSKTAMSKSWPTAVCSRLLGKSAYPCHDSWSRIEVHLVHGTAWRVGVVAKRSRIRYQNAGLTTPMLAAGKQALRHRVRRRTWAFVGKCPALPEFARGAQMQVCVRDETISGQSLYELSLEFLSECVTVRELIRERVHHEVREFNRQQDKLIFHGLVEPEDTERTLNGSKLKAHRPLDWEAQFALAIEGFATNAYFLIVDDRQAETLDETIVVGPQTKVSFIKLTPLVGG